jgi:hypothetical protein
MGRSKNGRMNRNRSTTYIYMYVYIYVHIYIIYIYLSLSVHIYMYIYIFIINLHYIYNIHMHVYIDMYICSSRLCYAHVRVVFSIKHAIWGGAKFDTSWQKNLSHISGPTTGAKATCIGHVLCRCPFNRSKPVPLQCILISTCTLCKSW